VRSIDLGQLQALGARGAGAASTPAERRAAEATKLAFSAAIARMFGTSLGIILLGFLVTLAIPALPLRERAPHSRLEDVEEALAGQATPAEVDPGAYPRGSGPRGAPPAAR
jgi:hypothetical protein